MQGVGSFDLSGEAELDLDRRPLSQKRFRSRSCSASPERSKKLARPDQQRESYEDEDFAPRPWQAELTSSSDQRKIQPLISYPTETQKALQNDRAIGIGEGLRDSDAQDPTETSMKPQETVSSSNISESFDRKIRQIHHLSQHATRVGQEHERHVLKSETLQQRLIRSEQTLGELLRESLELHQALEMRRRHIKEEKADLEKERALAKAKGEELREIVMAITLLTADTDTKLIKTET